MVGERALNASFEKASQCWGRRSARGKLIGWHGACNEEQAEGEI